MTTTIQAPATPDFAPRWARRRRRLRFTGRLRSPRRSTAPGPAQPLEPLLVRHAGVDDGDAIAAIAALDNGTVPAAGAIVALRNGRLEAVLDTTTGAVMADPFVPSRDAALMATIYAERIRTWPRAT